MWSRRRALGVAAVLGHVGLLWATGDGALRTLGIVLVIEIGFFLLPWRLPRARRSGVSFWVESVLGTIAPIGAIAVVLQAPSLLGRAAAWPWYLVAVLVGVALLSLGGIRPRSVVDGGLAFVLGPTPRSHGTARAFVATVGAVGEELLFRAPGVLVAGSVPLAVLGAAGFVGRHHVQAGDNRRGTRLSTAIEVSGACALPLLTHLSGSIYPAVLAHMLNNAPQVIVELQREPGRADG